MNKKSKLKKILAMIIFIVLCILLFSYRNQILAIGSNVVRTNSTITTYKRETANAMGSPVWLSCAELFPTYSLFCNEHGTRLSGGYSYMKMTNDSNGTAYNLGWLYTDYIADYYFDHSDDGTELWKLNPEENSGATVAKSSSDSTKYFYATDYKAKYNVYTRYLQDDGTYSSWSSAGTTRAWTKPSDTTTRKYTLNTAAYSKWSVYDGVETQTGDYTASNYGPDCTSALEQAESWAEDMVDKIVPTTTTMTYGYYKGELKDASAAESYVLAYMGDNGKSYPSYVQYAWWTVSGNSSASNGLEQGTVETVDSSLTDEETLYLVTTTNAAQGNDLAREALEFQEYINEVCGSTSPGLVNGYLNIDYPSTVEDIDDSSVDILYDSVKNVYRIGPLSLNYIRAGAQEGSRAAVSFSGISSANLIYTDADGNETVLTLDETGSDSKGFRIVYDHERVMTSYDTDSITEANGSGGKKLYYPYPYSNETFYIELDYFEDAVSVKELRFNFQYMNAGATYEDYSDAKAFKLRWEGNYEVEETGHTNGSDGNSTTHEIEIPFWWDLVSSTTDKSQKLINCTYSSIVDVDADPLDDDESTPPEDGDGSSGDDGGSGSGGDSGGSSSSGSGSTGSINLTSCYVTVGGWDLTTELAGFVWVEGIDYYEKGTAIQSNINSLYDEKYGDNDEYSDELLEKVEVRIMKVSYNDDGEELDRVIAKVYKTKSDSGDGTVTLTDKYDFTEKNTVYTDENGKFKVYVQIPSFEDKASDVHVGYDIEFIYDGMSYEAVEFLASSEEGLDTVEERLEAFKSIADPSKTTLDYSAYMYNSFVIELDAEDEDDSDETNAPVAEDRKEIPASRTNFDNNYYEIKGNEAIILEAGDDYLSTNGLAEGYFDSYSDSTSEQEIKYSGEMYSESEIIGKSTKIDETELGDETTGDTTVGTDADRVISSLVTTVEDEEDEDYGKVLEQYQLASRTSTSGMVYPYTEKIVIRHYNNGEVQKDKDVSEFGYLTSYAQLEENQGQYIDGDGVAGYESYYYPIDEYFHYVNLGLVDREDVDVSVAKDLYRSEVIVNQQEVTYKYSAYKDYESDMYKDYLNTLIVMQANDPLYELGLYSSDFYYRSSVYNDGSEAGRIIYNWKSEDGSVEVTDDSGNTATYAVDGSSELKMYATYKIIVYNDSLTSNVTINNLLDYYDSTFNLVTKDEYAYVTDSEGNKVAKLVAEQPYYRIYSYSASGIDSSIYKFNSEDDLTVAEKTLKRADGETSTYGKIEESDWNGNYDLEGPNDDYLMSELELFKYDNTTTVNYNYIDMENEFVLAPGERIELFFTYEIDKEGHETATGDNLYNSETTAETLATTRANLLGGKNNVAEIGNYTSMYTKNRFISSAYSAGRVAGRVDGDSAPGNINFDPDYYTDTIYDEGTEQASSYKTLDKTYFDDDADSAPVYRIYLREGEEERSISGTVWLDEDDDNADVSNEEDEYNTSTANGLYDEGTEQGIENITVSLVEKVRAIDPNSADGDLLEYEFIWPDAISNIYTDYDPVQLSDADGNYEFKNFTAGIYVVRFEYGNVYYVNSDGEIVSNIEYNGQDYENTAYQADQTNDEASDEDDDSSIENCDTKYLAGESTLNNEWQDIGSFDDEEDDDDTNESRLSDARDYEPQRLRVIAYSRTISNSIAEVLASVDDEDYNYTSSEGTEVLEELIAGTAMEANTAKLNIQIERTSEIDYTNYNEKLEEGSEDGIKVVKGVSRAEIGVTAEEESGELVSEIQEYKVEYIDFGLEERAETSLQLDKYLKEVSLTKDNGTSSILYLKINDDSTIDITKSTSTAKVLTVAESEGVQGFKYITMESSYFADLTVTLTYRIDIINESQVDWISEEIAETYTSAELREIADEMEGSYTESDKYTPLVTGEGISYGEKTGYYNYTNYIATEYNEDGEYTAARNPSVGEDGKQTVEYVDTVVTTTVDQVIEFIDKDTTIASTSNDYVTNQAWTTSLNQETHDEDGNTVDAFDSEGRVTQLDGLVSDGSVSDGSVSDDGSTLRDSYTKDNGMYYLTDEFGNYYISESIANIAVSINTAISKLERYFDVYERDGNGRKTASTTEIGYDSTESSRENAYGYSTDTSGQTTVSDIYNVYLTQELLPISYSDDNDDSEYVVEDPDEEDKLEEVVDDNGNTVTVPKKYIAQIYIETAVTSSSETAAENMNYNNLAEILVYSNSAGRRTFMETNADTDTMEKNELHTTIAKTESNSLPIQINENKTGTIPGNANEVAKENTTGLSGSAIWYAGHTSNLSGTTDRKTVSGYAEIDADVPEYITFTEPTGIDYIKSSEYYYLQIMLGVMGVVGIGLIGTTVGIVRYKRKLR